MSDAPQIAVGQIVNCHFPDGCTVKVRVPPEGWSIIHDYATHQTWPRDNNRTQGARTRLIPADRERLSQLLADVQHEIDLGIGGHNLDEGNTSVIADRIAEARAIVDQPAPDRMAEFRARTSAKPGLVWPEYLDDDGHPKHPNPALDAFLTTPIHEYTDPDPRKPTFGRIRHPLGWTRPERRHRAIRPLKLAVALTLAAIGLIAATALTAPRVSTDRPNPQTRPVKPAPEAAQTGFRPGDAPWNAGRRPGSPGNGLGVVLP